LLATALGLSEAAADELVAWYRAVPGRDKSAQPSCPVPDSRPAAGRRIAVPVGEVSPTVPQQLPAPPAHFVGRARELKMLDEFLADAGGTIVVSAISGTAGVGKTALAIHWAHKMLGRFCDGQLYANLRGYDLAAEPVEPTEVIRGFLLAWGVRPDQIPASLDAQTGMFRSLMSGRRVLIALDNARDTAQVRPLLPGSAGCLVLVTSRSQLAALTAVEGARLISLDVLSEGEAADLLAARLGPDRAAAEPGAITDLVRLCARLPLALAIASARAAAAPGLPLAALAAELAAGGGTLDALDAGEPLADVRSVFSWSYRNLDADTARLFRLLSIQPGPDISVPAAASLAGIQVSAARAALRRLVSASLMVEHFPGRFAFHDLLRAYAAEQAGLADGEASRQAAVSRMLDHYLHAAWAADRLLRPERTVIPLTRPSHGTTPEDLTDRVQAMAWFQAEHRVLLAVAQLAHDAGFGVHAWKLTLAISSFLDGQGDWQQMASSNSTALAAARSVDDKAGQAQAHRSLAWACLRLGHTDDSIFHLRQALGLFREMGDLVGQGRTHLSLALAMDTQDLYRDALYHNEQAVYMLSQAGDQVGHCDALQSVGWSQAHLGHYDKALACCREAIRLQREAGNLHGGAHTLDSLGYIYLHLDQYAESVACYEESAALFREFDDPYYQASVLTHLGDAHRACGRSDSSRDAWRQAFAILDDLGHADAAQVRARLQDLDASTGSGGA
jgi:tetratricopeptide (TPR) repeat protein